MERAVNALEILGLGMCNYILQETLQVVMLLFLCSLLFLLDEFILLFFTVVSPALHFHLISIVDTN